MDKAEYAQWLLKVRTFEARKHHHAATVANEKIAQASVLQRSGRSDHQIKMTLGEEALSDPVDSPVSELQQAYQDAKAELAALGISEDIIEEEAHKIDDLWPFVTNN